MNLGKLSKRLRKELLANPKQAAVLGIVCLVACWFWSPLLMKWIGAKPKLRATPQPTAVAEAVIPKTETSRPWYDIHRWRQADPLTRPALLAETVQSPFRVNKPPQVAQQAEATAQTTDVRTTPAEPQILGLTLEAIVYSDTRRVAQINGLTLREGEEITLGGRNSEDDDTATLVKGKVVTIDPAEVVVEVAGRSVRLKVQPKLLGRGEVVGRLKPQ